MFYPYFRRFFAITNLFNFSYDEENDDLFLSKPKSKSKGSVELGDFIFDYDAKKELVGIQIMNASKLISNMISENMEMIRSILNNLEECKIDVKTKGNLLMIKLYLLSKLKEISPIISIPSIKKPSPALAYA